MERRKPSEEILEANRAIRARGDDPCSPEALTELVRTAANAIKRESEWKPVIIDDERGPSRQVQFLPYRAKCRELREQAEAHPAAPAHHRRTRSDLLRFLTGVMADWKKQQEPWSTRRWRQLRDRLNQDPESRDKRHYEFFSIRQ